MPITPTVSITPSQLTRFERALGQLVKDSGGEVVFVVFKVAVDLFRDITLGTPVDTGRARAAWTVFFDRMGLPVGVSGKGVKSSQVAEGKREGEVNTNIPPQARTRSGARAVSSSRLSVPATLDRPFVELRNNVKYILPLEFGWSARQAPRGFVRHNVRRHVRFFLTGLKGGRR